MKKTVLTLLAALALPLLCPAAPEGTGLKLAEPFQDGCILAKDKPVRIFGEGEGRVKVKVAGRRAVAKAVDGKWTAVLPAMKAGGPYDMRVKCKGEKMTISDVYVGNVILLGGQSNLQFKLKESNTPQEDWKADGMLRSYSLPRLEEGEPFSPADGWVRCTKENAGDWSAIGYLVGSGIRKRTGEAVAIINCYQGASCIESWIPGEVAQQDRFSVPADQRQGDFLAGYYQTWNRPGTLFGKILSQIVPYAVSDVIWYQGESNSGKGEVEIYPALFEELLKSWRTAFEDENLPFVVVQLADHNRRGDEHWKRLQDLQARFPSMFDGVRSVRCKDVCETDNIHPQSKAALSERIIDILMAPENIVSVTSFGAVPDDGKDDTEALRSAAEFVRTHPGTTLTLPAGDYLLSDPVAEEIEATALSGGYGENPEDVLFKPYSKYVKGLDFTGARHAVIKGEGARILISGWMEAVSIEGCTDFRLEGLALEHVRKPLSEGRITRIDEDSFTVSFDITPGPIDDKTPFLRLVTWDEENQFIHPRDFYFCPHEVIDDHTVRFKAKLPERLTGARICGLHCFHYRPMIYIGGSDTVFIENVSIHSGNGMGITAFQSGFITMEGMDIVPAEGQFWSTNTDATHFSSCYGDVVFDHCTFCGQGDDATNVHGYYHDIISANGREAGLEMVFGSFTHSLTADVPRLGDTMALVRKHDLEKVGEYMVMGTDHEIPNKNFTVTLDKEVPADFENYYMIDETLMPHLIFRYCSDSRHRARGVLVKTHKGAEIHHNSFNGLSHSGVVLSAEANWKEGWQTEHASIHDNSFFHCGSCGDYKGSAIALDIKCEDDSRVMLHKDISIYDNVIDANAGNGCGILVRNAKDVTIGANSISGCAQDVIKAAAEVKMTGK